MSQGEGAQKVDAMQAKQHLEELVACYLFDGMTLSTAQIKGDEWVIENTYGELAEVSDMLSGLKIKHSQDEQSTGIIVSTDNLQPLLAEIFSEDGKKLLVQNAIQILNNHNSTSRTLSGIIEQFASPEQIANLTPAALKGAPELAPKVVSAKTQLIKNGGLTEEDKDKELEAIDQIINQISSKAALLDFLAIDEQGISQTITSILNLDNSAVIPSLKGLVNRHDLKIEDYVEKGHPQLGKIQKQQQESIYEEVDPNLLSPEGKYPIHYEAEEGNLQRIQDLVKAGARIDALDKSENNIAHIAALQKNSQLLLEFEKMGVDLNVKNQEGKTPLEIARERGLQEFSIDQALHDLVNATSPLEAQRALKKLPNINGQYLRKYNTVELLDIPINIAIRNNNAHAIHAILESPDFDFAATDQNGQNALHAAAQSEQNYISRKVFESFKASDDILTPLAHEPEVYISHKVEIINHSNLQGWTPLHLAATKENGQFLISNGAWQDAPDSNGKKAIDMYQEKVGISQAPSQKQPPKRTTEPLSRPDDDGNTVLHRGVTTQDKKVIQTCSFANDCLPHRNSDGKTPLHLATEIPDQAVSKTLTQALLKALKKANFAGPPHSNTSILNIADDNGNTPLHNAIIQGNTKVTRALIQTGASIDKPNLLGQTPLHLAAQVADKSTSKSITKSLLKAAKKRKMDMKTYVSMRDSEGRNAVHLAAQTHNSRELIKVLMQSGVDPRSVDSKGKNAVTVCKDTHGRSLGELVRRGVPDTNRDTVVDWEIQKKWEKEKKKAYLKQSQKHFQKARSLAKKIYPKDQYPHLHHLDKRGYNPSLLTMAVMFGRKLTIDHLLELGYTNANFDDVQKAVITAAQMGKNDLADNIIAHAPEEQRPDLQKQKAANQPTIDSVANPLYGSREQEKREGLYATILEEPGFSNPLYGSQAITTGDTQQPPQHKTRQHVAFENPMYDQGQNVEPPYAEIGDQSTNAIENPMYGRQEWDKREVSHTFANPMYDGNPGSVTNPLYDAVVPKETTQKKNTPPKNARLGKAQELTIDPEEVWKDFEPKQMEAAQRGQKSRLIGYEEPTTSGDEPQYEEPNQKPQEPELYELLHQQTPHNTPEQIVLQKPAQPNLKQTVALKEPVPEDLRTEYQKFLDNDGKPSELRTTSAKFVEELKARNLLENCGQKDESQQRKTFDIKFEDYKDKTIFYPRFDSRGKQLMENGKPVMDMIQIGSKGEILGGTFVGNPKFSTIPDKVYVDANLENLKKAANIPVDKSLSFEAQTFEDICNNYRRNTYPTPEEQKSVRTNDFPPGVKGTLEQVTQDVRSSTKRKSARRNTQKSRKPVKHLTLRRDSTC